FKSVGSEEQVIPPKKKGSSSSENVSYQSRSNPPKPGETAMVDQSQTEKQTAPESPTDQDPTEGRVNKPHQKGRVPSGLGGQGLTNVSRAGIVVAFYPVKNGTDFRLQEEEFGVCQIRPQHYLYIGSGAGIVIAFYPVKNGTDFRLQEEKVGVCQIRPQHYLYIGSGAGIVIAFYPVKNGTDFRLQEEKVGVCQIRPQHYLYIGS
ncbi:hypothetical protein KUCAC02_034465, partial [Chaenocephalus aceratus]